MAGVVTISQLFLIHNSIRLDESQSLWQSSHSLFGVLHVVALDVHVPLYHLMLHFWQIYFGQSIEAARWLSMIFFLLSIPAFYALARLVLRIRWALLATIVFSFSPFMNWYANEARMYTLLGLMAILSQYFFVKIIQHKKGWIGYSLTAMVGIYTHYFFFFNLLAQGIYFLFNRRHFPRRSFLKLTALALFLIAEISPWLYYFHKLGSGGSTSPHLARPTTIDLFNAFSQFAFGFQTDRINTILVSAWPLLVIVALLFVRYKQRVVPPLAYLLTAAILPVLVAFAASLVIKPFFLSRYMVSCVPPLTIFTIWLISQYRLFLRWILSLGLVAIIAATSYTQIHNPMTPVKEDYQAVAQTISRQATPRDLVVLSTPFTIYPFEKVYQNGPTQIQTLPIWNRRAVQGIPPFNPQLLPQQVAQLAAGHRYIYLVLSYNQGYENTIRNYFQHHYKMISQQTFSHDLTLYVFQVGYTNPYPLSALPANLKVKPQ